MSETGDAGRIVRVHWRTFRVPFATAAWTARATVAERKGLLVTIETSEGFTGTGEASPLREFEGGDLSEVVAAIRQMAVALPGRTLDEAWDSLELRAAVSEPSQRVARAGIETAFADVLAKSERLPLWRWLGRRFGFEVTGPVDIASNALVDDFAPAAVADRVRELRAAGFGAVKLKVGADGPRDLERVEAARLADAEIELRIDANGAWGELEARLFLSSCEAFNVAMCEQPLDPRRGDVIEATAWLRKQVGVPLALDESCRTPERVRSILAAGAADVIVVKPMFTGLRAACEMLRLAREGGLPVVVTTTFDSGTGTAMAAHVAALLPAPRMACGLATLERLAHPLVTGGHYARDGEVTLVDSPGLGVALDAPAVVRYAGTESGEVVA